MSITTPSLHPQCLVQQTEMNYLEGEPCPKCNFWTSEFTDHESDGWGRGIPCGGYEGDTTTNVRIDKEQYHDEPLSKEEKWRRRRAFLDSFNKGKSDEEAFIPKDFHKEMLADLFDTGVMPWTEWVIDICFLAALTGFMYVMPLWICWIVIFCAFVVVSWDEIRELLTCWARGKKNGSRRDRARNCLEDGENGFKSKIWDMV